VQFLRSLFCLQGLDNRTRFLSICSAVYVIFIMLISAFTGNFVVSLTLLAFFTSILALTTLRRIKDAKLNINWIFLPNLLFVIAALIVIFSEQKTSVYLLVISALGFAVLLTYPGVRPKNSSPFKYILGYFGPVDMSDYQQGQQAKYRIEPTLVGNNAANVNHDEQALLQVRHSAAYNTSEQQTDMGEIIRLKLLSNRKAQLIIAIIIAITLISVGASLLMAPLSETEQVQITQAAQKTPEKTQIIIERKHPLAMPDDFSLFISQHQGIIINWQADEVNTSLLWSQSSAQGDDSCQQISFNKGNPIRTLSVQVENDTAVANGVYNNYFASFSPLDSKVLIQALAFRGSFSLCGYDFSLKGSQAAIGKNMQYAKWVNY
jgi:uncharacterized membrane protein YhaH (DUF805 family)